MSSGRSASVVDNVMSNRSLVSVFTYSPFYRLLPVSIRSFPYRNLQKELRKNVLIRFRCELPSCIHFTTHLLRRGSSSPQILLSDQIIWQQASASENFLSNKRLTLYHFGLVLPQ